MEDGKKNVKARSAATGYQGPGLKDGSVDASGYVSSPFPHLRVTSLGALRTWKTGNLGIKNAFLQADGFGRDVFPRAPAKWGPSPKIEIARTGVWIG